MNYTTQMDAAKKGIITDEMKIVAKKESIQINQLIDLMAIGQVVIPANKNHKSLDPHGIGKNLRTKVNVNLGISRAVSYTHLKLLILHRTSYIWEVDKEWNY